MSLLEAVKSWTLGPWARRKEKKRVTVAFWEGRPVRSDLSPHLLGTPGTYRRRISSPFEHGLIDIPVSLGNGENRQIIYDACSASTLLNPAINIERAASLRSVKYNTLRKHDEHREADPFSCKNEINKTHSNNDHTDEISRTEVEDAKEDLSNKNDNLPSSEDDNLSDSDGNADEVFYDASDNEDFSDMEIDGKSSQKEGFSKKLLCYRMCAPYLAQGTMYAPSGHFKRQSLKHKNDQGRVKSNDESSEEPSEVELDMTVKSVPCDVLTTRKKIDGNPSFHVRSQSFVFNNLSNIGPEMNNSVNLDQKIQLSEPNLRKKVSSNIDDNTITSKPNYELKETPLSLKTENSTTKVTELPKSNNESISTGNYTPTFVDGDDESGFSLKRNSLPIPIRPSLYGMSSSTKRSSVPDAVNSSFMNSSLSSTFKLSLPRDQLPLSLPPSNEIFKEIEATSLKNDNSQAIGSSSNISSNTEPVPSDDKENIRDYSTATETVTSSSGNSDSPQNQPRGRAVLRQPALRRPRTPARSIMFSNAEMSPPTLRYGEVVSLSLLKDNVPENNSSEQGTNQTKEDSPKIVIESQVFCNSNLGDEFKNPNSFTSDYLKQYEEEQNSIVKSITPVQPISIDKPDGRRNISGLNKEQPPGDQVWAEVAAQFQDVWDDIGMLDDSPRTQETFLHQDKAQNLTSTSSTNEVVVTTPSVVATKKPAPPVPPRLHPRPLSYSCNTPVPCVPRPVARPVSVSGISKKMSVFTPGIFMTGI